MTRPNVLVRLAGSALGSLVLLSACGFFLYGWYSGHSSWVMGFLALGVGFRTLLVFRKMRAYKTFVADRRALHGEIESRSALEEKRGRGWLFVSFALLLAVVIPLYLPQAKERYPESEGPLLVFWGLVCVYLAWKLLQLIFRMVRGSAKAAGAGIKARQLSNAQAEDESPVSWLLGRASSSPARSDVTRELPAYCAGLLTRGQNPPTQPAFGFKVERKGRAST